MAGERVVNSKKSSKRVPVRTPLFCIFAVLLFEYLDNTVMFYIALISFAGKSVEVGAGRDIALGGIPELVVAADVGGMEYLRSPYVIDVKCVGGVGETLDKI
jgi:hypothetical protein